VDPAFAAKPRGVVGMYLDHQPTASCRQLTRRRRPAPCPSHEQASPGPADDEESGRNGTVIKAYGLQAVDIRLDVSSTCSLGGVMTFYSKHDRRFRLFMPSVEKFV
jgi:hypothetical protein